ncbi:MAG: 30S ribosomal protein S20 [Planctomycetaceae bacterium]|nr:30S ribosomal protein S20 [Planctomycetaceae bacterium]
MPNTKSAAKSLKQSEIRRVRNKAIKTRTKTEIKRVLDSVNSGDIAAAEANYKVAAKKLDQAGSQGVIHKNTAARHKSRMQRSIKAAKGAAKS